MIVLFRANGITASRVAKYRDYISANGYDYRIVGWDRLGENITLPNYEFFNYRTKYVQGGFKAIWAKIQWMRFVYKYIRSHQDEITTIHACDVDTAFPATLAKRGKLKDVQLIFDVCDWNSASSQNKVLKSIFHLMEKKAIKKTNQVIICEPERERQIDIPLKTKPIVMRNIPSFGSKDFLKKDEEYAFDHNLLTVSYMGWFGNGRFLNELLDCADEGLINLLMAGFGNSAIEERSKQLSSLPNVKYFGKVDYQKGLNIMYNADLIYAMYCKSIPNHFYAAPNKFYESMFLGRPILSTKGINMEDKINEVHNGFVIEETIEELEHFFKTVSREDLKKCGENAAAAWGYYNILTPKFMEESYSKLIK